ncbi:MAG: fasciclin domain-containing protein, partial [Bacteroidaceae bacterium]|nr:fasciclin domain-containing protein [Bacteroidaceae bacterium]
MKRILYILAIALSIVACSDEIDKSNRYTFTGETLADYLLNRSEKYSHMITLLKRADLFSLLQTYGQYTLFLPDNASVEKYVQEQDSIYWATKDSDAPVKTGITSPLLEDLSDSMVNVIARTHLVEGNYLTATFDEGALPRWNFYDRYLGISYEPTDEGFYIKVNTTAAIIDSDNEVENGVVHIMDRVFEPTSLIMPEQIAKYNYFSLFGEALNETRFCDSLRLFIDDDFKPLETVDAQYTPQKKYYRYTGFIETDEVFNAAGIYTLADLKAFAEKWYGSEERDNPRSPRNALNRFVAYH